MASIYERFAARRSDGKTAEQSFVISDCTDQATALNLVLFNTFPVYSMGIGIATVTYNRQDLDCTVEEISDDIWIGTAKFSNQDLGPKSINTWSISFDVSGQTQKVTQAFSHVGDFAPPGKTARNFQGAIGVTSGGNEGVEMLIPFTTYTINYTFPNGGVDDAYVALVGSIVGSVNRASFHGFDAGELLLTKVSGTKRSDGNFDISFGFSVLRNSTGLTITGVDGTITIPSKRGWDYLWVFYQERHVTSGALDYTYNAPISAHVEQIYKDMDYSVLGI